MNQPRVTWLLPVKNAMPYLTEALASIEKQTYRNWEVFAWDNGSDDGSIEELRRWIPSRLPGRVVVGLPSTLGQSLACMVATSETEYCARFDADDINSRRRLEEQVAFMDQNPDVGVVGTDMRFINEQGWSAEGGWKVSADDADIRWRLRFCNALNHPTVMFRRSVVMKAGNYRDVVPEDYDLWVRVACLSKMANLPRALLRYRKWDSVFSTQHGGQDERRNRATVARHARVLFPGLPQQEAMVLRDLAMCHSRRATLLRDCQQLRRAAGLSAIAVGQKPSYFRKTQLYRVQLKSMVLRWLRSYWRRGGSDGSGGSRPIRIYQESSRRAA